MRQSSLRKKILLNIEEDREKSKEFAENITEFLSNGTGLSGEEYSKIMTAAAKLMEARTKSNDQVVKVFETVQKYKPKKITPPNELSEEDIQKILAGESQGETVET